MHYVSRIYLGHGAPTGAKVPRSLTDPNLISSEAIAGFIADTVATTFPDGFTTISASGGWRDITSGRSIQEPTTIVEVYHTGSTLSRRKVRDVAVTYRQRLGQDAVMVSTVNLTEGVDFV